MLPDALSRGSPVSIRIGNLLGNFYDSFPRASAVALVPSSPDVSWSGRSHHPSASTSPPAPLSRPASSSPFLAPKSPSEAFGREARKEKSMTRRCNWPSSALIRLYEIPKIILDRYLITRGG